jgi:hypothetical protein
VQIQLQAAEPPAAGCRRPRIGPSHLTAISTMRTQRPSLSRRTRAFLFRVRALPVLARAAFGIAFIWPIAIAGAAPAGGYQTYVLVSNSSTTTTTELRATFIREAARLWSAPTAGLRHPVQHHHRRHPGTRELQLQHDHRIDQRHAIQRRERAIYWNANGVIWDGGGNTVGTRLQ